MVEMNESAAILNNITAKSFCHPRSAGTATYDGISIAWAIAEYLHQRPERLKTLLPPTTTSSTPWKTTLTGSKILPSR